MSGTKQKPDAAASSENPKKGAGKQRTTPRSQSTKNQSPKAVPHHSANEEEGDDAWECELCNNVFTDPNDMVLECQRCRKHYCIKCLNKSEEEYILLNKSDSMWFCVGCREIIEKNIITDLKIKERCQAIMQAYETRISTLEEKIESKCDEAKVKEIVQEEVQKIRIQSSKPGDTATNEFFTTNTFDTVISEINERKSRENNIIMYGAKEADSQSSEERKKTDMDMVKEVMNICTVKHQEGTISKAKRLGRFNKEGMNGSNNDTPRKLSGRPLMVVLDSQDKKVELFRNIHRLHQNENFKAIRVGNDLTRSERDQEKKLYEQAKSKEENSSGEYRFKVRGPPWARKVVKVPMEPPLQK